MKKRFYTTLIACCALVFSANAQNIVGSWSGPIKLPQGDLPFVINVTGTPGSYRATADSPKQSAYGMAVDTIMLNDDILRFSIGKLKVRYQGKFVQTDSVSGDFVQSGATFALGLRHVGSMIVSEEGSIGEKSVQEDSIDVKEEKVIEQEVKEDEKVANEEVLVHSDWSIKVRSLEPILEKMLKKYHVGGYAVAVVDKKGIVYSKGFGWRDVENRKPVTPNTLFPIGSSTKAFTAALVGKLADEGKVSLDSSVVGYLPSLRFYAEELNNKVTLRDMMSHRTGLPRYDLSWYFFPTLSRDSLLARVSFMKPSKSFRDKWQYNNFMYLAQGVLVERLSGKSWEKNIEESFFIPLGMKRSNTSISAMKQDTDVSLGYTFVKDSVFKKLDYRDINAMGPAGSINSSVNEMANWVKLWLNAGEVEGKDLLSKGYISDAVSSQMVISNGKPHGKRPDINFSTYGLGWMLNSYRGHYQVGHGGNIDGFSADVSFFPYAGLGIIVLSNQNASEVPIIVRNMIADKVLGLSDYEWIETSGEDTIEKDKSEDKLEEIGRIANTQPSHPLKDYTGIAAHPAFGAINFYASNDSLFAKFPDALLWMKPYHYDVFEGKAVDKETGLVDHAIGGLKFNFQSDVDGAINGVKVALEPAFGEPQLFRFSRGIVLSDTDLQQYTGVYVLGELEVNVFVKDKHLYISVPGQPEYKSTPLGNHRFKPNVLPGYMFSFEADAEGEIVTLYFVQPNGTFKSERKR